MLSIDDLEHGGPFRFRHRGQAYTVPGPETLNPTQILAILNGKHIPGTPSMPAWKRDRLFYRWAAHFGLPDSTQARRLMYVLERYRDAIEYDLIVHANGTDLGQLWRERRWRLLLNLIDHLPRHSFYSEAVSNDEEHAKLLADAMAKREADDDAPPSGPPMHTWTPELAAITDVLDAVRHVSYTVSASAGNKQAKPPKPSPRPTTALERFQKSATHRVRQEKHVALAKRLLPHKR